MYYFLAFGVLCIYDTRLLVTYSGSGLFLILNVTEIATLGDETGNDGRCVQEAAWTYLCSYTLGG
jgi:hypothetical protein